MVISSVLQTIQSTAAYLTGQKSSEPLKAPPVSGPEDIDTAASEFANRLAQVVRFTPLEVSQLGSAFEKVLSAARVSFGNVDAANPRNIAFPIQLALSFGTLFIQQALRVLVTYELVGNCNYPRFLSDFF